MGLNIVDCKVGTIVDHTYEVGEDERKRLRPIRRRGIIVKTEGNGFDAVTALHVQFKPDAEPEKVKAKELVRVYPATAKVARRALARVQGRHETVGAEFVERAAPIKPKLQDAMALTRGKASPFVEPEEESEEGE